MIKSGAKEPMRIGWRAKGYSDEWIDYRLKGVTVRKELTDEWKNRGVKEGQFHISNIFQKTKTSIIEIR